jgi:branched-chain amino acid transport system permease protein
MGLLMERVVFRSLKRAPQLISLIAAMGLSVFLIHAAILTFTPTPRVFSSPFIGKVVELGTTSLSQQRVVILIVGGFFIAGVYFFIHKTLWGVAFRAAAQDQVVLGLMGINISMVTIGTFMVASALAGVAGALVGPILLVDPFMGNPIILRSFVVVILGGFGNVMGTIFAAFLLGMTESISAMLLPVKYVDSVAFIVLFVVLLFRPTGIFREQIDENV